jgi:DNA-binding transcriptional MocR family regulator
MTSLSGSIPVQAAVAEYFQQGRFYRHLRDLRDVLNAQKQALVGSLARHLPSDTRITRPDGGNFLRVDLPRDTVEAVTLYGAARSNQHRPGPMFSNRGEFRNCLRLNFGHQWTP